MTDGDRRHLERLARRVSEHLRRGASRRVDETLDAPGWDRAARAAFDELWAALVRHLVCHQVRGFERALARQGSSLEDAVGELGELLYRRMARWDPARGEFVRWWRQVARNHLIDRAERGSLEFEPLDVAGEPADPRPGPEQVAEDAQRLERLGDVWDVYAACVDFTLATSSPAAKAAERIEAFNLVELAGLPNKTVAAHLGIAEFQCTRHRDWCKRRLAAAFRHLFGDDADGAVNGGEQT